MPDLTFGEQVKIVLGRKGMTIKELAEMIEQRTDKKMSRQNLTQRLGRDNFQEQDMRMIASILECPFRLSILGEDTLDEREIEAAGEAFAGTDIKEDEDTKEEKEVVSLTEDDAGADLEKKGGTAVMTIETDGSIDRALNEKIRALPNIIGSTRLEPV